MSKYLAEIVARKQREQELRSLKNALRREHLTVIAEIKRKSPSKGVMKEIVDPVCAAEEYCALGAAAISVLTDKPGFGGSLGDLSAVAGALSGVPVLRKDFIVHLQQLRETCFFGGTAVLLIVAVLQEKTKLFIKCAQELGLEPLVEVHNEEELDIALLAGAEIIGVNNRNLKTFTVDLCIAERLAPLLPREVIKIAASGIKTGEDALRMKKAGYDAILVGEALTVPGCIKEFII